MINVKVYPYNGTKSFEFSNHFIFTPNQSGIFKGVRFIDCDAPDSAEWALCEGLGPNRNFNNIPIERRIFFISEPRSFQHFDDNFYNQYGYVVGPNNRPNGYKGIWINSPLTITHFGKHWGVSQILQRRVDYNDFIQPIVKSKLISFVSSIKIMVPEHINRVKFLSAIAQSLQGHIDIFCREIKPIEEKYDACAPYKYIIATENEIYNDYFTEKLLDGILCQNVVFYYGAPNIVEYFDTAPIIPIDIKNHQQAIQTIATAINNKIYEKTAEARQNNLQLAMENYHSFAVVWRIINGHFPNNHGEYRII